MSEIPLHIPGIPSFWVVAPEAAGSSPVTHPPGKYYGEPVCRISRSAFSFCFALLVKGLVKISQKGPILVNGLVRVVCVD